MAHGVLSPARAGVEEDALIVAVILLGCGVGIKRDDLAPRGGDRKSVGRTGGSVVAFGIGRRRGRLVVGAEHRQARTALRPASLASYMASSARSTSSRMVAASTGYAATPQLSVTAGKPSCSVKATRVRILSATWHALVLARLRENDSELLAADPARDVEGAHAGDNIGDGGEHVIPSRVTVFVVDLLEVVEVRDDEAGVLTGALRPEELGAQRSRELPLVEQTRQPIVGGEMGKAPVGTIEREPGDAVCETPNAEAGGHAGDAECRGGFQRKIHQWCDQQGKGDTDGHAEGDDRGQDPAHGHVAMCQLLGALLFDRRVW